MRRKTLILSLCVFTFLASAQQIIIPKDNPQSRIDFEILRTKNPYTNEVPVGIRKDELEFMRTQNAARGIPFALGDVTIDWYNRGPHNVGGRTRALAVDSRDEDIILAGGVSGGMWRSLDGGVTWSKTTGSNELQSVSCIAQDPTNPDVWYYGTGELAGNSASGVGASYYGNGIYKSSNNGASWSLLSSTSAGSTTTFDNRFDFVNEIAVDPTNGDVYAATYDGIYLSTNGGSSFGIELGGSNNSYWTDVVISSTGDVYVALDGEGIFQTDDAITWNDITPAMSVTRVERKELAISGNDNSLYMLGENDSHVSGHELWHYNVGTTTWTDRSSQIPQLGGATGDFDSQGGYDLLIIVSPTDEDFVLIGGTSLFRSTDGFATTSNTSWIGGYSPSNINSFGQYTNHHADQHSFVFLSGTTAISGNDGGVQFTSDITASSAADEQVSWTPLNNGYLTTQVYAVSAGSGDQIMAGFQDNSTWLSTSTSASATWTDQFSGDGAYNAFNSDGTVRFLSAQNGQIFRAGYSNANDQTPNSYTNVQPSGYSSSLFIAPFYLDPNDDEILYMGGANLLFVNSQASTSSTSTGWESIDLGASGNISEFGTTSTAGTVYIGTTAGEVFLVTDATGTESVTEITGGSFPSGYVSGIGVNPENTDELLVSFSNYGIISVWHSSNAGTNWTNVSGTLEENTDGSGDGPSVRTVAILGDGVKYFAGTSTGLYSTSSFSGTSTSWTQESSSGIGDVVVEHMVAKSDGTMVIGTHGNGVFTATYDLTVPIADDLEVTSINSPTSGSSLTATESVTATITNNGTDSQNSYSLTLNVDGSNIVTDNISTTILSSDTYNHVFSQTIDLSVYGDYEITVTVSLTGDEDASNDANAVTVSNTDHTTRIDYTTLESFYNSNGGSGWTTSTNWLTSEDFSNWFGLTVDGDGRVTKLELPGNNVTGSIPSFIDDFDVLVELDLSNNSLTDISAEELGNITTLEKIDLSSNAITSNIPASITSLSSLTHLHLNDNNLTEFRDLSGLSLTEFEIQDNELDFGDLVGNLPSASSVLDYSPQANIDEEITETINEGDDYTMSVTELTSGNEYQWTVGGVDIGSANSSSLTLFSTASFLAGVYSTEVTNPGAPDLTLIRNDITLSVNQYPTDISLSSTEVEENQSSATTVAEITGDDPEDESLIFTLSGTDASQFDIVEDAGTYELITQAIFDYETDDSYEITITATDPHGAFYSENFTISVIDQTLGIVLSNTSVNENEPTGTQVGILSVETDDLTGPFTYSLSGDNAILFRIGGSSDDELQTNSFFDHEDIDSYELTITATDGTESVSSDFTITILDVNDSPGSVELSNSSVGENLEAGTIVGAITTNDNDEGETFTYSIFGDDAASFDVVDDNLVTTEVFNFEDKQDYDIGIQIFDSQGASDDDDFTISVIDGPDAPTGITLSETSFDENDGNEWFVSSMSADDEDSGETQTFELSGADASSFKILGGNDIYTNMPIDFETKNSYELTVTVTDKDDLTFSDDFTITVNDVDEAITDVELSNSAVVENEVTGTAIGTISPVDDALGSYTYGISGTDAASFQLGGTDGNELQTTEVFDFESENEYSIELSITENGTNTVSKEFTVTVVDTNEAPTELTLSQSTIDENEAAGTVIGALNAADEDAGDSFSFSLSGEDASSFSFDDNQLISTEVFDFETKSSYSITITVEDNGGLTFSDDFTITIDDVVEEAPGLLLSGSSISENEDLGTIVGVLSPDGDGNGTYTYAISGEDASSFQIGGSSNDELQSTEMFNFENKSVYSITITLTEVGVGSSSEDYGIVILDANDAPTAIVLSNAELAENLPIGSVIGNLSTTDEDDSDTFSYMISGADGSAFNISGSDLVSSEIFDFEAKAEYQITVTSADGEGAETSEDFTITITDEEEPLNVTEYADKAAAYPNPVVSHLTVEIDDSIEKANWTIVDLSAKNVFLNGVYNRGDKLLIDLTEVPTGIYVLKLETKQYTLFRKVVKN